MSIPFDAPTSGSRDRMRLAGIRVQQRDTLKPIGSVDRSNIPAALLATLGDKAYVGNATMMLTAKERDGFWRAVERLGTPQARLAGVTKRKSATRPARRSCPAPSSSGASEWMVPYHDLRPVLLNEGDFDAWLKGDAGPEVLKPAAEEALREWTVSKRVNRTGVGDDDPTIVEPVAAVA